MARKLIYSGLVAGLLSGCQSVHEPAPCCDDCVPPKSYCCSYMRYHDNLVTELTAAGCAKDDLKELAKGCGHRSKHFDAGFRQSYIDVAMGRPAATPPTPPKHYWNAYYRSCAGSEDVAEWFEGYRTGLEYAGQGGVSRFNRVATSWPPGTELYARPYPGLAMAGTPNQATPTFAQQAPESGHAGPALAGSMPPGAVTPASGIAGPALPMPSATPADGTRYPSGGGRYGHMPPHSQH